MRPASSYVTRSDVLAETIRKRIQDEQLEDGDLFMTADQVMTEYQVSRTVAREACSRLKALGILEGRKRRGLVVRRPDPVLLLSNSLPSLVHSVGDLRELAQLRYVLEVGAIELAVKHATAEQIATLGVITDDMEQALSSRACREVQVELDVRFHSQILQMTGSRMVSGMQRVLLDYFRIAPHDETTEADAQRITWEHRELYRAIRDRDVERARSMIRVQFRFLLEEEPVVSQPAEVDTSVGDTNLSDPRIATGTASKKVKR